MDRKQQTKYEMVDTEGLCVALAEHDYKQMIKDIPEADIEVTDMIERAGQVYVEKDTHSRWVLLYQSLIQGYKSLINEYVRK